MNKNRNRIRRSKNILNKFIDFNKNERIYYNNLYLDEYKIVIKIPLSLSHKNGLINDIKIEEFNLTDSVYFFSYI